MENDRLTGAGQVSRRGFVAGAAALAGAGALAASLGAGAGTAQARIPSNASDLDAGAGSFPMSVDEDPYFAAPDPIADVAQTYDYDVVVIGAGAAGVPAACAAADNGAKVAVLQKNPRVYSHGHMWSGWNASYISEQKGTELTDEDIAGLKAEFMELTHYGAQTDLLNRYFEEAPESIDWQIAEALKLGFTCTIRRPDNPLSYSIQYDPAQISTVYQAFADDYADKVDWYYSTPALQLVQDGSGAVTGAIAQDSDGNYLQFNASKGVVIATGGFGGNKELVARWLPECVHLANGAYPADNTGDGALMAIWAGAAPCPLVSKKIDIRFYGDSSARTNIEKQPFLLVNDQGQRIGNENASEMWQNNYVNMRPSKNGTVYYCIFDANYGDVLAANGQDRAILSDEQVAEYKDFPKPLLWEADTLAELAEQIGVDADALQATVDRYNELADKGVDEDFYKEASWLYRIEQGPFYAMAREYSFGGTLGAISVNADCQAVSRATGEGIQGLYVVGNDMGGLQTGQDYVWHDYGFSLGSATTFGYMVGRNLARA